jgi:hypothetical protein
MSIQIKIIIAFLVLIALIVIAGNSGLIRYMCDHYC